MQTNYLVYSLEICHWIRSYLSLWDNTNVLYAPATIKEMWYLLILENTRWIELSMENEGENPKLCYKSSSSLQME